MLSIRWCLLWLRYPILQFWVRLQFCSEFQVSIMVRECKLLWLLTIAICLLAWGAISNAQHIVTAAGEVLVPLSFKLSDGSNKQIHLSFMIHEENLEQIVTNFCEVQNIRYHFCHKLFSHMQRIQNELHKEEKNKQLITESYKVHEEGQQYQRPSSLRNPNFIRYREAIHAQLMRSLRHNRLKDNNTEMQFEGQLMMAAETQATAVLKTLLQQIHEAEEIVRIAVIHSEAYSDDEGSRELRILLDSLKSNGLMDELQLVLVIQYGKSFKADSRLTADYPQVTFIHLSDDLSFGEIPTLRIMRNIAHYLTTNLLTPPSTTNTDSYKDKEIDPVHVLYMRTLTTEYQSVHESLEDWRSLLLYHLVEEHWSCFHLLESREIDVVAANFVNNPRGLNGNYFLATSNFLAQLSTIPYDFPRYESIVSEWLFTFAFMKIHVPHISGVNHYKSNYPRYCYASSEGDDNTIRVPSYEEYKRICSKKTLEDYSILHNQSALQNQSDFPPYSEEFHNINSPREVTSSCSSLELSIVFDS